MTAEGLVVRELTKVRRDLVDLLVPVVDLLLGVGVLGAVDQHGRGVGVHVPAQGEHLVDPADQFIAPVVGAEKVHDRSQTHDFLQRIRSP